MTARREQVGAIVFSVLMLFSMAGGSVVFTGSTAAVDSVSSESQLSPSEIDENTTETLSFNYSFTNVSTSGETTLSLSLGSEFTVTGVNAQMEDASGSDITSASIDSNNDTIEATADPSTSTVYLSGSINISAPSVDSQTEYTVDITGSDNDGDIATTTTTLTVDHTALTAGTISQFSPATVGEQTTNQHSFNYSFDGVSKSSDTTFSLSGPSGSTITATDLKIVDPSGSTLNATPEVSGNSLSIVDDSGASTAYLTGSINLTSPEIPADQESATYDITASASDDGGSDSVTNTLTVEFDGGQAGDPELESAIQYVKADGTPAVEVAFSEDVQNFASNYELSVEGEGQLGGSQIQSVSEARGRAVIEIDQSYSQPMTLQLDSGIQDPDGHALVSGDVGNTSVQFAPSSVTAGGSTNAYQGAKVSIVASTSNTGVQLEGTDDNTDSYFFDGSTGTNSRIFVFATADRDTGDYRADINSEETADITIRSLGLSVDIGDRNITNLQNLKGTVEAGASNRPIRIEFLDENGDPVDGVNDRIVSLSGQGDHEFSYDLESLNVETGEYTIRAIDTTSGVSIKSDTITVREGDDSQVSQPDRSAPVIEDINILNETVAEGDPLVATVTVTDRTGIESIALDFDGINAESQSLYVDRPYPSSQNTSNGTYRLVWNETVPQDTYRLDSVSVSDTLGNSDYTSVDGFSDPSFVPSDLTVTVEGPNDSAAPTIEEVNILNETVAEGDPLVATVTVTDRTGIESIALDFDGINAESQSLYVDRPYPSSQNTSNGTYRLVWNETVPQDTYRLDSVSVSDTLGNSDYTSVDGFSDPSFVPSDLTVEVGTDPQPQPPASVTFGNQTVPNGSTTVAVESAQFGDQSVPGEEFVVVVHKTTDSTYGSSVGAKIGESDVLSPGSQQDITVNLSGALGPDDDIAALRSSRSLVAMLHRANTTDSDGVAHSDPITRNGDPVTDRASVTVTDDDSSQGTANATLSATDAVGAPGSNVTITFNLTNQGDARGFILNTSLNESAIQVVNQSSDGGVWNANETKWLWQTVESNSSVTASLTVRLPESAPPGTEYTVSAEALAADGVVVTTNTTVSTALPVDEAIDTDNNGQIGDLEILTAIEYWRDDTAVPQTGGKTIGDFQILELIEAWRLNREV